MPPAASSIPHSPSRIPRGSIPPHASPLPHSPFRIPPSASPFRLPPSASPLPHSPLRKHPSAIPLPHSTCHIPSCRTPLASFPLPPAPFRIPPSARPLTQGVEVDLSYALYLPLSIKLPRAPPYIHPPSNSPFILSAMRTPLLSARIELPP
ncbi:unnamed protein product [Closterium sp. Yama58-4]|nr:unnamed protein product [Closterium sp. Yama58-4]